MAYNKNYYEQNKLRISQYNKARRLEKPEIIENERKSYKLNTENYKLRAKVQFLKGKMAWEMLSKKKQQGILAEISEKLGVDVK
tara:strand:- start:741 stop:992 length:252 start_codon:yes stop_codon:yes gene_type:complete